METPLTTQPPSEAAPSTTPTTPSSNQQPHGDGSETPTNIPAKVAPRTTIPALPVVPIIPKQASQRSTSDSTTVPASEPETTSETAEGGEDSTNATAHPAAVPEPALTPKAPVSWAAMARGPNQPAVSTNGSGPSSANTTPANSTTKANQESFADALQAFSANSKSSKIAFIEPRGLVNTGNMCYMNSVSSVFSLK